METTLKPQPRDAKGEWQPEERPEPSPLFQWPLRPGRILRYVFGFNGLLFPFNAFYLLVGALCWLYLTPGPERTRVFSVDWIALLYLRNALLLTLVCGLFHLLLYVGKRQGIRYKYSDQWQARNNKRFLFGNQVRDNMFWSLVSGVTVWTAFEALTLWAYSRELLPRVGWREHPIYCTLLLVGIIFLREAHFYLIHRPLHWRPLMRRIHFRHHRNVNVGPWSGTSMHPIEHLLYFSGVFLHWVIPSHPIHAVAHLMHAALAPAQGHAGFDKAILHTDSQTGRETAMSMGGYFHYLHHRHFTVNYGVPSVPLDFWFGSAHDGSPDADAAMRERRTGKRQSSAKRNRE